MSNSIKTVLLFENSLIKKEYFLLLIFLIIAICLTVLIIGVAAKNPNTYLFYEYLYS